VRYVRYAAEGWGVGELVLDGDVLVHSEAPSPSPVPGQSRDCPLAERLRRYFAGSRDDFLDVELDLDGATPFQRAVCDALRSVPYGETVTYGELAALAGHPNAQRAVGSFCAHNRFSIVVPCHRVVAAAGVGSYGSLGVPYKQRLLELEGAALR
jgi:methylated-DNA-[protein]-cysteine S-methyltransferase